MLPPTWFRIHGIDVGSWEIGSLLEVGKQGSLNRVIRNKIITRHCFESAGGAVRASHLAKKSQNKTPGVFFHAAFDFDAPGPRNTVQK